MTRVNVEGPKWRRQVWEPWQGCLAASQGGASTVQLALLSIL